VRLALSAREMKVRHLLTLPVLLTLTACASLHGVSPETGDPSLKWRQRSAELSLIHHWSLTGRAVVKSGRKSWHFGLRWKTSRHGYSVELKTPLGQGVARLHAGADGAELEIPNEPTLRSTDARTLLAQRFGWKIPTSLMNRWILGVPADQQGDIPVLDGSGVALEIREAGWDIRYRRYKDWAGYLLPATIVMNRGDMEVRVVIDDWVIDG